MGWNLRRSINIGGIRLNLSKKGVGVSVGVKGLRIGRDANGNTYTHASIPGTGVYRRDYYKTDYSDQQNNPSGGPSMPPPLTPPVNPQAFEAEYVVKRDELLATVKAGRVDEAYKMMMSWDQSFRARLHRSFL